MAKPFSELTKNFSPERKAGIEAGSKRLLAEYDRMVKASEAESDGEERQGQESPEK